MAPDLARHRAFFARCASKLPQQYTGADTNRMTLLFFALGALDLLDAIDATFSDPQRREIIEWVYAQHLVAPEGSDDCVGCGFRGAPLLVEPPKGGKRHAYDVAHVTMTYNAIQILLILGDDLSRIDRRAVLKGLAHLQNPDGSFAPYEGGNECDMRFMYCACAVSAMLGDWSGMDRDKVVQFILASQSYQQAFGQRPLEEGHAGSTYCAVASLALMGRLEALDPSRKRLVQWCVLQQDKGFHGRTNKLDDTCYSFWVGASLAILDSFDLINKEENLAYLGLTQTPYGGYGKVEGSPPDLLHAYMGVAALSLSAHEGILPLDPALNLAKRTAARITKLEVK